MEHFEIIHELCAHLGHDDTLTKSVKEEMAVTPRVAHTYGVHCYSKPHHFRVQCVSIPTSSLLTTVRLGKRDRLTERFDLETKIYSRAAQYGSHRGSWIWDFAWWNKGQVVPFRRQVEEGRIERSEELERQGGATAHVEVGVKRK